MNIFLYINIIIVIFIYKKMKKFILFIINKPTTVSVTLVSIFIIGFVSISKLKVDYLPNMEIPIISVKTVYENSAPEEVEKTLQE